MKEHLIIPIILICVLTVLIPCVSQAKITDVEAGSRSVMVLSDTGHIWIWGDNSYGQMGLGTTGDTYSPDRAQKVPLDNVKAIAMGGSSCYALKRDGTVWAWGNGASGRLGNGGTESQSTPVQVKGLTDISAVSASGANGYALKSDGTVYAWGRNNIGQLGCTYNTIKYSDTPVQIAGPSDIVTLGENGNYAVRSDGTVYAWGDNTLFKNPDTGKIIYGFLGDISGPAERPVPFKVPNIDNVKQITNGAEYSTYLKNDGTVWGWGHNGNGESGDGTQTIYNDDMNDNISSYYIHPDWVCTLPPVMAKISDVKQLSSSDFTVTALKTDGTVWEWGTCMEGAIGGSPGIVTTPMKMSDIDHVIDIKNSLNTIVLKDDGTVWGWGCNDLNKLKSGSTNIYYSSPQLLFKEPDQIVTTLPISSPTINPTYRLTPTPSMVPSCPPESMNPITATPPTQVSPITVVKADATEAEKHSNSTAKPANNTIINTPVPLPTVTSVPTPGIAFSTIALLGCLLIITSLLSGLKRRESR